MKTLLLSLVSAALLLSVGGCQKDEAAPGLAPVACTLVPDAGMCMAAFQRYYYDPKDKQCRPFTWGGCAGVVPFVTLQECQACGCEKFSSSN